MKCALLPSQGQTPRRCSRRATGAPVPSHSPARCPSAQPRPPPLCRCPLQRTEPDGRHSGSIWSNASLMIQRCRALLCLSQVKNASPVQSITMTSFPETGPGWCGRKTPALCPSIPSLYALDFIVIGRTPEDGGAPLLSTSLRQPHCHCCSVWSVRSLRNLCSCGRSCLQGSGRTPGAQ